MIDRKSEWYTPPSLTGQEAVLLFSACDMGYLEYAISLLLSVDVFSPGHTFILHVINPDPAGFKQFERALAQLHSTAVFLSFETTDVSMLTIEQQRAYFASARFLQLKSLLSTYSRPVFSIDADSLVVNPIDLDFSDKADAEVILVRRDADPDQAEHLAVATGSIWLAPVENVIELLGKVANDIDVEFEQGTLAWFVDQKMFYRRMKETLGQIHFYNIKAKYADWHFRDKSILWAGKGGLKLYDLRFFILQNLLSFHDAKRLMAQQLISTYFSSQSSLFSEWMQSRIEFTIERSLSMKPTDPPCQRSGRIALYIPRLDLPWKQPTVPSNRAPEISEDVVDLRLYWKRFALMLANALERQELSVDIYELPNWQIDRQRIEEDNASLAFIPHRCDFNFGPGLIPVMFYMQEFFRWAFVVNDKGWSAASSEYPVQLSASAPQSGRSFDDYRGRLLKAELASKFAQKNSLPVSELIQTGALPSQANWFGGKKLRSYIFFPVQIPTDQSIEYFSDIGVFDAVTAVIAWAKEKDVALVLKLHPANRKSMIPFANLADGKTVFVSDANVNDLITHSRAVYTINSGVGFESLLHLKPVITFGRVEYDCVTFNASTETLDEAWEYVNAVSINELETKYRCFFNWFMEDYSIDLSSPTAAKIRLDAIATQVAKHVALHDSIQGS